MRIFSLFSAPFFCNIMRPFSSEVSDAAPDFVKTVTAAMLAGLGD
ncbi:hypothetical protein FK521_28480, partial [Klebsiella pneumoniae]|nr:hypothetical protein [Klebsiella pneumoniae]